MNQPLLYVRGSKRDSLRSVCKEFFSVPPPSFSLPNRQLVVEPGFLQV
jgi:hypothetical protein